MSELHRIDETLWEIPASARPDMRVPARVFADEEMLEAIARDQSLEQLQNVATLPGIVDAAYAMPDIHQGYGFPVGGLAATELPDGVVSPGGVGYDINCGVRLLAAPFTAAELGDRREALVHELSRSIPAGTGKGGGGARGLGHQVCTDYVKRMDAVLSKYGIDLPDRQLSCAPASSPEGQAYLAAMAAAANFAWSNRQEIANRIRRAIARVLGREAADQ